MKKWWLTVCMAACFLTGCSRAGSSADTQAGYRDDVSAQALVEARRQAGRVLWLNPIPQRKWPYMASIQTMSGLCQMAPCSTLDELARSCRKMIKG